MKRNIILSWFLISLICGCTPSTPYVPNKEEEAQDTIPTIVLSEETTPIIITVIGDSVMIKSKSIDTRYAVELTTLSLKVSDGDLTSINLNGEVQLLGLTTKYHYLDANTVVVQRGQTLSEIVKDHRGLLNDNTLSVRKVMDLNNLKTTYIHAGQELRLY